MGETLRGLGFEVIEVRDGSRAQMASGIDRLRRALDGRKGVGMLYYAGHGLQIDARNYMVPVDAKLSRTEDVATQTVDVGQVLDAFKGAGSRMNIVVLDACRDNPFGKITTGRGLAPLDAPASTFLAYATAPGNVAADGDAASGNGLYTQHLLQELRRPQARIEDVFKRVRFAVRKASNGRQIPWESTSLEDDFQFNNGRLEATARPNPSQINAEFEQERGEWERIRNSSNPDDFYAFLQRHPNGPVAEAAHVRLNSLTRPSMAVQGGGADGGVQVYAGDKFRVGDVYEQRFTLDIKDVPPTRVVQRVQKVEADRVEVLIEYPDSKGAIPSAVHVYDGSGGTRSVGSIISFDPPMKSVPAGLLQMGQRWVYAYRALWTQSPAENITVKGQIVGKEKIEIPAGSFHAFKIEYSSTTFDEKGVQKPSTTSTAWLSPEYPIPLKLEVTVARPGLAPIKQTTEMAKITHGT